MQTRNVSRITHPQITLEKLLSPTEAAEILGVTITTLANWRCLGRYDLGYVKVGRKIGYMPSAILAFIAKRTHHAAA